jgi:hypothetical protein
LKPLYNSNYIHTYTIQVPSLLSDKGFGCKG